MSTTDDLLRVVGIGASAGGLDAFEKFFRHTPPDTGFAYVLVQHLDPNNESILSEILQRYTEMAVQQAEDDVILEPNRIYVIPPNRDMKVEGERLKLNKPTAPRGLRLPVDTFFRSLAEDRKNAAVAVVLSGTGSDGSLGIKAVKGAGGLTIAQDPETITYTGMPISAISTGMIDYVVPVEEISRVIRQYIETASELSIDENAVTSEQLADELREILNVVSSQTGHDFSQYKPNTIVRRIERRMAVNRIESLSNYLRYLRRTPSEMEVLFQDLLIGVTNFFRDPEAFEVLKNRVVPRLVKENTADETIRVWVPACSTGEEAISITILLKEYMREQNIYMDIQVFATDIDSEAIRKARLGRYPGNIALDVPDEYLRRYFIKVDESQYQVGKSVRSHLIFAEQSVVKDPPFSNIDLVSCRNLLIYLNSNLQEGVLSVFHYALRPGGYLFLGGSENANRLEGKYKAIDSRHRLYRKIGKSSRLYTPSHHFSQYVTEEERESKEQAGKEQMARKIITTTLMEAYVPPSVLVDESGEILHYHGNTQFLWEPDSGRATLNILRMVHKSLRAPLTIGLRRVQEDQQMVAFDDIIVGTEEEEHHVRLVLRPRAPNQAEGRFVIISFEPSHPTIVAPNTAERSTEDLPAEEGRKIDELKQQVRIKEEYLQSTIEELRISNAELARNSEEYQSTNEELRSTNEELETSREELQSINEEILTVNAELQEKVTQLNEAYDDQSNILRNVNVGILFLDEDLNVQLFNPVAGDLFNLIDSDIGRPITQLAPKFTYRGMAEDIRQVTQSLEPHQQDLEVDDRWYRLRIRPYRTREGDVDGSILTLADITRSKRNRRRIEEQQKLYRTALKHLPDTFLALFDSDCRHILVEGKDLEAIALTREKYRDRKVTELDGRNHRDLPITQENYQDVLERGKSVYFAVSVRERYYDVRIVPIYDGENITHGLILATDVTARKKQRDQVQVSEERYRLLVDNLPNVATLMFDRDYRYVLAQGDELLKTAGYEPAEILGKTLGEVLPSQRAEALKSYYDAALAGEEREYRNTINGVELEGKIVPVRDENDEIVGGMIVVRRS